MGKYQKRLVERRCSRSDMTSQLRVADAISMRLALKFGPVETDFPECLTSRLRERRSVCKEKI